MKRLQYSGMLLVAFVYMASAGAARGDDAMAIQGTWDVVAWKSNGDKRPLGYQIVIGKDTVTFKRGDKVITPVPKYKVDSTATPKQLDMTLEMDGKTLLSAGIYVLEKDSLKLCYGLPGAPRPKEFKTVSGDGQAVVELKRAR